MALHRLLFHAGAAFVSRLLFRFRDVILMPAIACAVFAFALLIALPAFAQNSATEFPMLGLGARSRPEYDGSNSQRTEPVPVLRYYGSPWFVRSTRGVFEGGARTELAPGLVLGAQFAYEPGRSASHADFLASHDVADIHVAASVGVHLEWDQTLGPVPVNLVARIRDRLNADRGTQADLRLTAGIFRSGPVAAGVFTQATWANAKSAAPWYGITPQQSTTTGLPVFDARSGLQATSIGLIGSFDISRDWIVVGSLEGRHLRGDAARSPLTERSSNHYLTLGLAYRF